MARDFPRGPVVLFDGVCNLCNASVQFILDHEDPRALPPIRFVALQSELGGDLLKEALGQEAAAATRRGLQGDGASATVVLVETEDGRVEASTRSTAVLKIARRLRAPWRWAAALLVVPAILRDPLYGVVARNRYRWFGKSESCRVPTPELRARFLA